MNVGKCQLCCDGSVLGDACWELLIVLWRFLGKHAAGVGGVKKDFGLQLGLYVVMLGLTLEKS